MVLNYQRWTPPCGCSFEEEVDTETGEIKLLFAHAVCGGHEDIAKNTPKPKAKTTDEIRNEIISKKEFAWNENKRKNLDDFENHENTKRIKDKVAKQATLDADTQFLHESYLEDKKMIERHVDNFTKEKRKDLLLGLECEYALNAHDVYHTIHEEHKKIAEEEAGQQ